MFSSCSKNILFIILTIVLSAGAIFGQTSGFTYQGRLTDGGTPANGSYDLQFALFDAADGNNQIGQTQTISNVPVSAGVFTVTLDFGANAFSGAGRFLQINTRPIGAAAFTPLTPRQPITSTPYAVRSLNTGMADTAVNAQQLAGVAAVDYVKTGDARLSDPRDPKSGSANYIQNSSSQQAGTNFNISGNGTAGGTLSGNTLNAATQYNINGNRVLGVSGVPSRGMTNTFAGVGAGTLTVPNPTFILGHNNSFFGNNAGAANTDGANNSFFGNSTGNKNTTGTANSFFGVLAGSFNTTGYENSFFGVQTGLSNTTGADNSFFGVLSGSNNSTGSYNSSFGSQAGGGNLTGSGNSYFGFQAGGGNSQGDSNSYFGRNAGMTNTLQSFNTFLGAYTDGAQNITNATAVGARAQVTQSNTLVLGSINGVNGATADTRVGIGTTAPTARLSVNGNVQIGTLGSSGNTQLCWNTTSKEISTCSSSLRYKTDLHPFSRGLNLINRLNPITFKWKNDQSLDLGLGAEDVAAVEPLLVSRNEKGQVEGVKYDRLSAVFINAFKEQQAQIEQQETEAKQLRAEAMQLKAEAAEQKAVAQQQRKQIALLRESNEALNARLSLLERSFKRRGSRSRR
jgi:hypothetical protein